MIVIDGVLYKTPKEISCDWNVSPQVARVYIRRYHVPVLEIEDRVFVIADTPKPTSRTYRKHKDI